MTLVSSDPVGDVEREIGLLLRRAQASSERIARKVHPDLDSGAYPLLVRIGIRPGLRASELAAHIGIGRGTMSRQLARLEELGLIERTTDPDDARGQLLRLTPAGAERLARARGARAQFLREALEGWDADDVSSFAVQLGRFNADVLTRWAEVKGTGQEPSSGDGAGPT